MSTAKKELFLKYTDDGVANSGDYSFYLATDDNTAFLWELKKDGLSVKGKDENKSYYMLTLFPNHEVQKKALKSNNNKGLHNIKDLDNGIAKVSMQKDVVSRVVIMYDNGYILPRQTFYVDNNRIYAEDDFTGIVRELVKVTATNKETGMSMSVFLLSRGQDMNIAMFSNLVRLADNKIPPDARARGNEFFRYQDLSKFTVKNEDVIVMVEDTEYE